MTHSMCLMLAMASLLVGGAAAAVDSAAVAQADELERRWAAQYLKPGDAKEVARLDKAVAEVLPKLGPDGRFTDLAYGPKITGRDGGAGWGTHLLRTVDLFTAWRTPGTKVAGDAAFARRAAPPLEAYLAMPVDKGDAWGYGHPYADLLENNRIGRICLFARRDPETFTQEVVERWAAEIPKRSVHPIFARDTRPETQFTKPNHGWEGGANVMWATRGDLVPYLVSRDQELRIRAIDRYMRHIWTSQTVRSPKGPRGQIERLTVDGMLGEHAAPSMGAYGEWYINDVVEYRNLIQGLPRWQMPAELNAHWIDVLLDSVAFCYQGSVDPFLGNPLYWLNARSGGNSKLKAWLVAFSSASDHRAAEVKQVLAWNPGVTPWPRADRSIKYYYTTDYLTKHYPRFAVSLRSVSERTCGNETFGQDEASCHWAVESVLLPLGTMLLRRDTREFQDTANGGVWSAMDYARLPSQTTRHISHEQLCSAWNRDKGAAVRMVFGGTGFAGGVTTAHTGVMGWQQSKLVQVDVDRPGQEKRTNLSVDGRRAAFLLEDAVVHLGAAFDLRHPEPTLTSVEQRASLPGATTVAVGDQVRTLPRGEVLRDADVRWVWQQDVGYLPPADGVKVVQDVQQPGKPAKQVFSIWSDHGREAAALAFEWAVLPDVKLAEMPQRATERGWRVLANTAGLQAIEVPARGWLGAVFHGSGVLQALSTTVHVDRPCVLIVERQGDRATISCADPLGLDGDVEVRLGRATAVLRLPAAPHLGATVSAELAGI